MLLQKRTVGFTKLDIACLLSAGLIIGFWKVTQQHFLSNMLLQFIMILAYLPTWERLLKGIKNTESFPVWWTFLAAAMFSILPARLSGDLVGTIYAGRAFVMTGFTLGLMLRIEWRFGKGRR
jgi:hypothetical protein